jgi:hypothetical protein
VYSYLAETSNHRSTMNVEDTNHDARANQELAEIVRFKGRVPSGRDTDNMCLRLETIYEAVERRRKQRNMGSGNFAARTVARPHHAAPRVSCS